METTRQSTYVPSRLPSFKKLYWTDPIQSQILFHMLFTKRQVWDKEIELVECLTHKDFACHGLWNALAGRTLKAPPANPRTYTFSIL